MKSLLSPRLLACCSFIAPHSRVADVGCDHGYLGITLLQKGLADHIYAGDVNEGPLQSAVYNAEKYGVQDHIQFFLSDGLRNFPRDFDTLVCAGMGADTIVSILEAAPWIRDFRYTLVLQCQSKTPFLRQYLSAQQWNICEETVVRDGRFLYTVMKVTYPAATTLTPAQCYFPPALLVNPSAELANYYRQVTAKLQRAIDGQKDQADPNLVAALHTLQNDPCFVFLKEETK